MALHGQIRQSYLMHVWGIPLLIVLLFQIPYRITLALLKPDHRLTWPVAKRRWVGLFIFLSLMLPWAVKTVALFILRYL